MTRTLTGWYDGPRGAWDAAPGLVDVDVILCSYAEADAAKLVPVDPGDDRAWLVELVYSEARDQYRCRVTRAI